ncbi:MAG: TSUP family transporter [Micropepsaceae bacterium]
MFSDAAVEVGLDFVIVGLTAFLASGLTLYSGFGLGTILLPAFAIFFPTPVAVAATGAVHLMNNLFKGGLLGRQAHWPTVLSFGLPAIPFAILGAWVLSRLASSAAVFEWSAWGKVFGPTPASLIIGCTMIAFAVLELQPWFQRLTAPKRLMPLGGALTGFIGGLSGQQGALRSMFLLKSGLEPARFIPTGVLIAMLVDLSRLPVYAISFASLNQFAWRQVTLVAAGTVCAFAGAFLGARYLAKATMEIVRIMVAALMSLIGAALAAGVIGG